MDKPCLNCRKRYVGCHSTCKDYLKSKEKTELIKKEKTRGGYIFRLCKDKCSENKGEQKEDA